MWGVGTPTGGEGHSRSSQGEELLVLDERRTTIPSFYSFIHITEERGTGQEGGKAKPPPHTINIALPFFTLFTSILQLCRLLFLNKRPKTQPKETIIYSSVSQVQGITTKRRRPIRCANGWIAGSCAAVWLWLWDGGFSYRCDVASLNRHFSFLSRCEKPYYSSRVLLASFCLILSNSPCSVHTPYAHAHQTNGNWQMRG